MSKAIELVDIHKSFGRKTVLDGINFCIEDGDYVAITGSSGAGKTTLINIIGTIDREYKGNYFLYGREVKKSNVYAIRNGVLGFIFQQYNLINELSGYENIILPYVYSGLHIRDIRDIVMKLSERFGLENILEQRVTTMSGGEKQRIALVRSIVMNPQIIIADEPTGNLDSGNAEIVSEFLTEENKKGKTIVVVTHSIDFASKANKRYIVENGYIKNDI